jgi:ubiquitin carboxyl-terminal hydrolase 4/11/15
MWLGTSGRIAPHDLKKCVGKRVTKFAGYGQQDSCELINYVLDLLHEDLNRVRKKPYVEMSDSNDRPDSEVSKEHWDAFQARNKSIIVDLMYGQLKSTVECQECHNISITFDPFLSLALPIAKPFNI